MTDPTPTFPPGAPDAPTSPWAGPGAETPAGATAPVPPPSPYTAPSAPAAAPSPAPQAGAPYGVVPPAETLSSAPGAPYAGAGLPPYGSAQAPYGAPAYAAGVPPYGTAGAPAPQRPTRPWPWVAFGCLMAFILVVGGCTSCAVAGAVFSSLDARSRSYDGYQVPYTYDYDSDDYGYGYGYGDGYGDGYGYGYGDTSDPDAEAGTFRYDEIAELLGLDGGRIVDGACSEGLYAVGEKADIAPGLWLLGGTDAEPGEFYVFRPADGAKGAQASTDYELIRGVSYFGWYFTPLEEGDLIAYRPPEGCTMRVAGDDPVSAEPPYRNGCYRVGTDIPAGTYEVTVLRESALASDAEAGAYVMNDLEFNDGSVVDAKLVIVGGRQRVTVTDGQYLELFAAQAVPVDDAAQSAPAVRIPDQS